MISKDWELSVAELWDTIDDYDDEAFIAAMDRLAAELPADDAIALFERASARDSMGHSDLAVPLYEAAMANGLSGIRRRRAAIQRASSLRNLGRAQESADALVAELGREDDELTGAVRAFLALALVELGREREAVSVALAALSAYLPRYNQSLRRYAEDLVSIRQR